MKPPTIAYGERCTTCGRMHGPDDCRVRRKGAGEVPAPVAAPAASQAEGEPKPAGRSRRHQAMIAAAAAEVLHRPTKRPARPITPDVTQAPDDVTGAVMLPSDVLALAVAAAGDEPLAEWLARLIRAHKPPCTPAERQRRKRERERAQAEAEATKP